MSEWDELSDWWRGEAAADPVFATDVAPLADELISQARDPGGTWLDLGCGEGRMMRALDRPTIGCDLSRGLVRVAADAGPVVRCRLPDLAWLRPGSVAGAYAVLTIEHLADLAPLFAAVDRVVVVGGSLVVVSNHPAFTAPGSGPIVDLTDGEVLWRWGPYFTAGEVATVIAGAREVTFHHRPLGDLLSLAARCGWILEQCVERPLSAAAVSLDHGYAGQEAMPRLVGMRWTSRRSR